MLGIDTLGILRMVDVSVQLDEDEVDGTGLDSLSADVLCLVEGGSIIGRVIWPVVGAGGTLKSGLVEADSSECDRLCLTSYSSILFWRLRM